MTPRLGFYAALVVLMGYILLPFSWMVISSLQTEAEIVSKPPHWIPERPTLENYVALATGPQTGTGRLPEQGGFVPGSARDLLPALRNSIVLGLAVAAINLLLGSLAAYALARYRFRGRQGIIFTILGLRIVPDVALVIPFFLLIRSLGLHDNLLALVLTHAAFTLPFTVFILAGYMETIPEDLDQAAKVDGCTPLQVLTRIILPVARPGLIAAAVFAFMMSWNELLFALVMTSTTRSLTLPVIVATFTSDFNISFALMNAAGVVAAIPPVVFALLFQRYLVAGLTRGALRD